MSACCLSSAWRSPRTVGSSATGPTGFSPVVETWGLTVPVLAAPRSSSVTQEEDSRDARLRARTRRSPFMANKRTAWDGEETPRRKSRLYKEGARGGAYPGDKLHL